MDELIKTMKRSNPEEIKKMAKDLAIRLGASSREASIFSSWCSSLAKQSEGNNLPIPASWLNRVFFSIKDREEEALLAVLSSIRALEASPLTLPARLPFPNFSFCFSAPSAGWESKDILRRWAKKCFLYRIPINLDPPLTLEKPMNLGRWLFGIPGFRGHISVLPKPDEEAVEVHLSLPDEEVVAEALKILVEVGASGAGWKLIETVEYSQRKGDSK